jgi:hypothetical protein
MLRDGRAAAFAAAALALGAAGCSGGEGTAPLPDQPGLVLDLSGLRPLDPAREGHYEAWVISESGQAVSAGRFSWTGATVTLANPGVEARAVEVTIEPPDDSNPGPSLQRLLTGALANGRASLSIEGALTQGTLALKREPGQFTMFSPSDNLEHGYPSFEESGVWLFNIQPRQTPQNDGWVRLAQLRSGWVYEGWMVRDHGTSGAIWLSYGKFLPDQTGAINSRDDTGWGPFSGVLDFQTAGEEEYPGDDWISNPLGLPLPNGITLPLDLRQKDTQGRGRWSHVITTEPSWNRGETITTERPFLIAPYRDPFGDGAPGTARTITYREDGVPHGTATLR